MHPARSAARAEALAGEAARPSAVVRVDRGGTCPLVAGGVERQRWMLTRLKYEW